MKNFLIKLLGGYTKAEYWDMYRLRYAEGLIDKARSKIITSNYECTEEKPCQYHPTRGTRTDSTSTVPGNKRIEIYSDTEQHVHEKLEPKKQKQTNGTKKRITRPRNTKKQ